MIPEGLPRKIAPVKTVKPINFAYLAPEAKTVSLIGNFNTWDPAATPMQRQVDGAWKVQVNLGHGHYQYLFLVDGQPTLDPRGQGIARNERNERVSLLSVS